MEEWRKLTKTVLGTLFNVGCDVHHLLGTVSTTRTKLAALATVVQTRRAEVPRGDNFATLLGGESPSLPFEDLDRAIRELARLDALFARAALVFLLYGGRFGLDGSDDESWQSWLQHNADTLRHSFGRTAEAPRRRLVGPSGRGRYPFRPVLPSRIPPLGRVDGGGHPAPALRQDQCRHDALHTAPHAQGGYSGIPRRTTGFGPLGQRVGVAWHPHLHQSIDPSLPARM